MSGDRPRRTSGSPPGTGSGSGPWSSLRSYESADDLVRDILNDRPPTSNISPSGELLRAIGRQYGMPPRRHSPLNPSTTGSMPPEPTRDLQRRFSREPRSRTLPHAASSSGLSSLPPLRGINRRTRRYLETTNMLGELEHDIEELEDANTNLRALLEISPLDGSVPPPSPPLGAPSPPYTRDHSEVDSRRVKRRKLDSNRSVSEFKGFRYGQYGQVEPGPLVMEIVSCDGGIFPSTSESGAHYAAENILKSDNSVYCTKGNRCNIILQHQGATIFTLSELVIKAPGRNYSAPVREGMAFLSMENNDVLQRTAQYQIQYLQPSRSSLEREARVPIVSIRHNEDGSSVSRTRHRHRLPASYRMGLHDDDDEYARAQIPSEFSVGPAQLHVTTECVAEENEEGAGGSRYSRRPAMRIGSLSFEGENDDWDHDDDLTFETLTSITPYSRGDSISLSEAAEASQLATQEAVRAVGGELMVPCARFNIEKDTTKCIIRFDPPVSGRYLLLKMWNPHQEPRGNIDIRGVVAKGFAGPRYCPAIELR